MENGSGHIPLDSWRMGAAAHLDSNSWRRRAAARRDSLMRAGEGQHLVPIDLLRRDGMTSEPIAIIINKQKARHTNLDEECIHGRLLWRRRPRSDEETMVPAMRARDLAAHGTGRERERRRGQARRWALAASRVSCSTRPHAE